MCLTILNLFAGWRPGSVKWPKEVRDLVADETLGLTSVIMEYAPHVYGFKSARLVALAHRCYEELMWTDNLDEAMSCARTVRVNQGFSFVNLCSDLVSSIA